MPFVASIETEMTLSCGMHAVKVDTPSASAGAARERHLLFDAEKWDPAENSSPFRWRDTHGSVPASLVAKKAGTAPRVRVPIR